MSKNYDNWERLVAAVLRREKDRQIALEHSFDSSSMSLSSVFHSDRDDHDHDQDQRSLELPLGYSDLSLDHNQWKAMLPPDKQQVVWRSASMSLFLDQRSGKNCFLFGAKKLVVSGEVGFRGAWEMKSDTNSRFSETATFLDRWVQLDIRGRIDIQSLSPDTQYAAYLVFALTEIHENLERAFSVVKSSYESGINAYRQEGQRKLDLQSGYRRADGWMEIKMGDFYVPQGVKETVQVQFLETSVYRKSGLILEVHHPETKDLRAWKQGDSSSHLQASRLQSRLPWA